MTTISTHAREPVWKGPYEDGLTQSLIAKWINCPHRFWLYAICGAKEETGFNLPIVYGDAFHNALEAYAMGRNPATKAGERIKDTFHKEALAYPRETDKIGYWSKICYDQFLAYADVWAEEDATFDSFMEEQSFCEEYTLPDGRKIKQRGKWDMGIVSKGDRTRTRYLKEHKIKGEIDAYNLTRTLAQNFQVMYYLPPLYAKMDREGSPRPQGVLYNVIQRPLAGRKHSIVQKKGRKVKNKKTGVLELKGAETTSMFQSRLAGLYKQHPDDFFYRWKVSISEEEVERFRIETLDPLLTQMCNWWDSIQGDPFDPWNKDSTKTVQGYEPYAHDGNTHPTFLEPTRVPNPHHYRRPFGIFDKMAKGLTGDYQEYLTTGDKSSLRKITTVFPELD